MHGDAEPARKARTHGGRVLLVDDNATNRRVLTIQMSHAGYEVEAVSSADEALAALRAPEAKFDVAVLDYQMPDMDGAMLGEQIMSSADDRADSTRAAHVAGACGDVKRFADIGFSAILRSRSAPPNCWIVLPVRLRTMHTIGACAVSR